MGKLRQAYRKVFPDYTMELEKATRGCESLLDVGCGSSSPIKHFSKRLYAVGIDAFKPSISKSRKQKIHNKYYVMSVLDIGKKLKPKSFDCVLASDLIEHLTKKQGLSLIAQMERVARKKVIIFTPNGFLPQGEFEKNPWQVHKSGWAVNEMRKKGYKVIGISGWKPLRGEFAGVRFWPKYFWLLISDLTQLIVRGKPEKAFQILCVKELKQK